MPSKSQYAETQFVLAKSRKTLVDIVERMVSAESGVQQRLDDYEKLPQLVEFIRELEKELMGMINDDTW